MLKHFALAVLSCASVAVAQPALADYPVSVHLQRAEHYTSPLQVDILDESPRIRDFRTQEQAPNYVLHLGAPQVRPAGTINLAAPGPNAGNGQTFVLDPNHPPPAGFISNLPGHSLVPAGSLPSGSSTNQLLGRMAAPAAATAPHAAAPHMISTHPRRQSSVPEQYAPLPSASSSGGQGSSVNVTGIIKPKKMGDLLR